MINTIYLIAFGKPAGHGEVAPRKFDVHSRWNPAREVEEEEEEEEGGKTKEERRRRKDEDKAVRRKRLV